MTLVASVQGHRRALGVALAGYLAALIVILGWPTPVDASLDGTLFRVLGWLHGAGLPGWIGYNQVEFAANIALFVPVGLLVALELRSRPWWVAGLAGFGLSVLAELSQSLLRPDRFATVQDVVANTTGALLGAAIAVALGRQQARLPARSVASAT